jgi:hypothetical protein
MPGGGLMGIEQIVYETALAEYSNTGPAIALLKQHRPYLEMLPSMRRPEESLLTLPLPVIQRRQAGAGHSGQEALCLPCDVAILMCDPEWKIKTGVEVFVFIHRPQEDFSELLGRWRQTQVCLSQGYEWDLPLRYKHILNEGAEHRYPLFVVFDETPERIKRGLKGAFLPFVVQAFGESAAIAADPVEDIAMEYTTDYTALDPEVLWTEGNELESEA